MTFAHKVSLLEVLQETASEEALVLVNNEIKRRNFGGLYLKEFQANLPDTIFNTNVQRIVNDAALLTASLKNQTAGHVFAAPIAANGTPSFRALQLSDISDYTTHWTKNPTTQALSYANRVVVGNIVDNGTDALQVGGAINATSLKVTGLTTNYIPKVETGGLLGNSLIYDNGTGVGIGTINANYLLTLQKGIDSGETVLLNLNSGVTTANTTTVLKFSSSTSQLSVQGSSEIANIRLSNSQSNLLFRTSNGASLVEAIRILGNGNVGIGITNPLSILHLNKNGGESIITIQRPSFTNSAGVGALGFANKSGNYGASITTYYESTGSNMDIRFRVGTPTSSVYTLTEVMRLNSVGLAIGTPTATHTLTVGGTTRTTKLLVNELIDNGNDKLQVVGSGYFSTRLGVGLSNTDSGIAYAKAGNLLIINHLEQGSNYYDATTHSFRGLNAGVTTLDVFGAVKSRTGRFEVNHEDKTGLWAYDVNGEVGFLGKANSAVGGVIMSNSVTDKAIHVSNDGHAYYNYKRILLEGDITNGATNPGLDAVVSVSHYVNNRTVDYWVNASATFQTVKSANGAALKAELFWQDTNASGNGMEQLSKIGFRHSASGFSVAAASDSSLLLSKDTFFAKLKITSSYSALQFLDSADVISSVLLHNSTGISLNAQNAKFGVGSANGGSAKAFYAAGISEITLGEDRLNDDPSTPIGLGIKLRYNNKFRGGIWYDNTPAVGILKFGTNLSGAIGNNEIDVEFNSGRSLFILATHDLEIKANLNHATDGFVKKLKIGHVSALDILEINGTKVNFFRGTTPTNGQRFELVSDATGTLYLNPIN